MALVFITMATVASAVAGQAAENQQQLNLRRGRLDKCLVPIGV